MFTKSGEHLVLWNVNNEKRQSYISVIDIKTRTSILRHGPFKEGGDRISYADRLLRTFAYLPDVEQITTRRARTCSRWTFRTTKWLRALWRTLSTRS